MYRRKCSNTYIGFGTIFGFMHPLRVLECIPGGEGTTAPSQPSARFRASKLECSDGAQTLERYP